MTAGDRPEYDTNILHQERSRLRREMLIDRPWTEVILVRHAQQSFDPDDLEAGGAAGPGLSAIGSRQARLTGELLADEPLTAVYSSRLTRAVSTADAVAALAAAPLTTQIRNDLREIEMHGEQAEDGASVRDRLRGALTAIAEEHSGQTVAAVSHGGAISTFLASLLGVERDIFFFAAHASVTRVRHHDGAWAVQSVNETGHLRSHDLISH
ncbi:histidine phosphatase family protein [Gordonia amicalis]|uniref:Histidine phosphatase family protein n=1 Tax=Gordonia amicalis TaxID=89053 RepID=A0AAE4R9P2_9ACTN|nr:histidine phosphatase family protein [Gordonia amicalis]MDV6314337.1 histidine phosphatase family protein [Gordonia amicalis]